MINRKDTPAPFLQRAEVSASSRTVTTTTTTPFSANASPHTPQNKLRIKRASKLPGGREAHPENNARASADETTRGRISHDLNLTDNPRHSVVDNMLLSLNPDQPKIFSPSKERSPFSSGSESSVPPQTAHSRHLHSSSTNSDYTFPSDGSPDRRSYQFRKGRGSNSSPPFRSTLQSIDSIHTQGHGRDCQPKDIFGLQTAGEPKLKSKGHTRKSSRGSGSSSVDYGQTTRHTMMMPPNSLGRRSASFDHGYARRGLHSASSSGTHPTVGSGLPPPVVYNDIEAAPMPTVPAGPRRGDQSPAFPPHSIHSPTGVPMMQRRNSNKSSRSLYARQGKDEPSPQGAPPPASHDFLGTRRRSKQVLPVPSYARSGNVSPTRLVSGQVPQSRQGPAAPPRDPAKERPGFFRRVFGSSRGPAPSAPLLTQKQNKQTREETKANHRVGQATMNRLYKPPAMEDLTRAQTENVPTPLIKKPSSFFRRRKKSVSDNITSAFPPHLQSNLGGVPQDPPQHSPTSSLRKVMNPYLDGPMTSPRTAQTAQFAATAQNSSIPSHGETTRLRPSTEPSPRDPVSMTEATEMDRRYRNLPRPLVDTSNASSHPPSKSASTKPVEISSLDNDSNDNCISGPNEYANASGNVCSTAPTNGRADLPPRSTLRNIAVKPGHSLKENSGGLGVMAQQETDLPSLGRNKISRAKDSKAQDQLTDTETIPAQKRPSPSGSRATSDRLWLQGSKSDEDLSKVGKDPAVPVECKETSPGSEIFRSASSSVYPVGTKDVAFPQPTAEDEAHKLRVSIDLSLPTEEDRRHAKLLFDGDETVTPKSMAAAWLGEPGPERARARRAYMEQFKWQNLNILAALRDLCGRLYLKGESQQVDRILDAFSARWCSCNPLHGFKASDVVHTICYSILLLNTDLHQAEIETKMTRAQFLRNIMPTIRRVVTDAAPDAFANPRQSTMPSGKSLDQPPEMLSKYSTFDGSGASKRSFEGRRPTYKLHQRPSDQTVYTFSSSTSSLDHNADGDCGPLVRTSFRGKISAWESQIESVLKNFYNSVRQQPLPLFGAESKQSMLEAPPSANSLSAATGSFLRRTPSMLSKAGSECQSYSRGRTSDHRLGTSRWQSKVRSRHRIYPGSIVASSRRSSFDEQSSVTSPSVASAWSRFSSIGKTQTTFSTDSFASTHPQVDYQQSIGFANALSQAIIREEGAGSDEEVLRAAPLLEDESLELHGAPWAKEGILKHKHHLESIDKKAKDRNWVESFCVIEKGYMRLFSFSMNAKSLRQKAKAQKATGGVVGGGNWADNAELLGSFVLRQTLASGLPDPGYSKARPHVWALSLPTGAIHLFQVGTPEIVKEFVATANYWSARLSKEPLVGGVSNIEYGWSDSVINAAIVHPAENTSSSASVSGTRPSLQSSIRSGRSSMDQGSYRSKLHGDKILIHDWTPPPQSVVASALMEVDQLAALSNYVKNIEEELQKHNELRGAVLLAFSPRHTSSSRAMTNWERKSSYLLHELVKFKTYIDSLREAQSRKATIYTDRDTKGLVASNTEGGPESKAADSVAES